MNYQYLPYIWLLFISAAITFFLGVTVLYGRRKSKGASYFVLSMFVLTLWSLPNALEMMAVTLQAKLFWANVQYIAYCYSPVTLMALCMDFTGYDRFIKNKKIIWFAILPAIIIILVWTNNYHGLIRYDVHLDNSDPFPVLVKKYGIAFYIHAAYSYSLNLTAVILLIRALFVKKSIYRKQAMIFLIGTCFIIIPNIIYILGLSPLKTDITPVFFGPAGIITMWAIFRLKLFELGPLARTKVTEIMNVGVMVMDLQNKVMDMNPTFLRIVDLLPNQYYDNNVEEVCNKIPELVDAYQRNLLDFELTVNRQGTSEIYEVLFTPLKNKKGKIIGKLVVFYEITEKKQAQQEFLKQQRALARLEEKERLARDLHDNLGQLLGFINMQAQGVGQELRNSGINIFSDKLDQLAKVTQIAHAEIREYINEVRTSVNSEQDFAGKINNIISLFEYQTGIKVNLDVACNLSGKELKPYLEINLLNIMKEALNNIRKHANARNVQISLQITEQQLQVSIRDDGKGFVCTSAGSKEGFGLNIMKERALLIGGQLSIQTDIGKGTMIIISVPFVEGSKQNADEAATG